MRGFLDSLEKGFRFFFFFFFFLFFNFLYFIISIDSPPKIGEALILIEECAFIFFG